MQDVAQEKQTLDVYVSVEVIRSGAFDWGCGRFRVPSVRLKYQYVLPSISSINSGLYVGNKKGLY